MTAHARFRTVFGRPPEVAWHAPGRVNLIGEHTDYNDGFVLPFALEQGVTALAAAAPGDTLRVVSGRYPGPPVTLADGRLRPGAVTGWAAYPAAVVWRLRREGLAVGGMDLLLDATVPSGAGLSSSAAVECAVGMAVDELFDLGLGRERMAELAREAETEFVGVPCGVMDQCASLLCTRGHALYLDTRSGAAEQVPLDVAGADLALLLVDTASPRRLVAGEYATRRHECERAAAELGVVTLRDLGADELPAAEVCLSSETLRARVRHVVTENARVPRVVELLREGRSSAVGPLLTASHESLCRDYQVSSPEQDLAVRAALEGGAPGARMTGGGFGGSVIALVPATGWHGVAARVSEAFADSGLPTPTCTVVRPGPGARRLTRGLSAGAGGRPAGP